MKTNRGRFGSASERATISSALKALASPLADAKVCDAIGSILVYFQSSFFVVGKPSASKLAMPASRNSRSHEGTLAASLACACLKAARYFSLLSVANMFELRRKRQ